MSSWLICNDCGVDTAAIEEHYMLQEDLWQQFNMPMELAFLCISCVEVRLKRRLQPDDFIRCPMNSLPGQPRSERLLSRLYKSRWRDCHCVCTGGELWFSCCTYTFDEL